MRNTKKKLLRYTAAYFTNEDDLKGGAAEARLRGLEIYDVYSPFPVHGIDLAVGLKTSRITWAAAAGGATGLIFSIFLQLWTSAYDWPLNIGGKPFSSPPPFCSGFIRINGPVCRADINICSISDMRTMAV